MMNERIRALAEQAWDYVDSQNPYASDEHEMFQEKFAELIVLEAARWLGNREFASPEALKQHFGVER